MASIVRTKTGKKITLLNPAEKAKKYSKELKTNVARTNDGKYKLKNKKAVRLTKSQRAYRAGYLSARSDGAKVFNAKKKRRK